MAGVTILIDAVLPELRRVGASMRIVAVGTNHFAFSEGHMRRAQQLCFALEMALAADFNLRAVDAKGSYIGHLRELLATGFFHQGVAVDAGQTAAGMRARLPVSLNAALVAGETGLVLYFGGFAGIFAERDHPANALAAASGNMIAPRAMAIFASSLLGFVTRIEKKNASHHRVRKFLKGGSVAGLTDFVADVSCRA